MAQNWKKLFARINWNNRPSTATPLGASNLNKSDYALDEIDNRVIQLDTLKADMSVVNDMVADVTIDTETGIITVTKKDGSTQTYDTKLEKIAVNFDYDSENQRLVITLDDGTIKYVDMSALISEYDFTDTDSIAFSVNGGNVSAIVKDGSITESKLHPNYLANIKGEVAKAEGASDSAAISSSEASDAANLSKSYAVGSTGTRADEDTDNAKFYSEKAKDIVDSFEGVTSVGLNVPTGLVASNSPITSSGNINVTFADNYSIPTNTKQSGWDAKYTKPSGGIPKSDLASSVQDNLDAINSKYSKPSTGIPKTDLASSVQTSLGKADTALQTEQYKGTYNKPSTGIPKSDLSQEVQTALDGGGKTYTFEGGTNQFTVNSSDGTTQDVEVLPNIQSITQAQYDALTDKTGTYFIKDSVDVINASEVKYGNTNVASGIENAGLTPNIEIPTNTNLNTMTYCNVGRYYCPMTVTVATLSNCPTTNAFVMEVYSPLSKDSTISPTGSVYRVRKILDYKGNEYIQYIEIINNTPTYDTWRKKLRANDVDSALSTTSTNAVQNKVINNAINDIKNTIDIVNHNIVFQQKDITINNGTSANTVTELFKAPKTGFYLVCVKYDYDANANGFRRFVYLDQSYFDQLAPTPSYHTFYNKFMFVYLIKDQSYIVGGMQNSGANLRLLINGWARYIG